jgi:parvulin-like peptidyl-prolyl isomerase
MPRGPQPALARRVRGLRAVIVAMAGAFAICAANSAPSAEPKVVARVNGEVVTEGDARRVLSDPSTRRQLQQDLGFRATDANALYRLAVKKLVEHQLLLQEARRRKLEVSEQELDRAVLDVRRRFDDLKALGAWMKVHELNDRSLFDILRDELLIKRAALALVQGVQISDKEIKDYYESHKEELRGPGQFRLQIIVVESKDVAQQLLMDVYVGGADFGQLARARSRGTRAERGGDTGWVSWKDIPPPVREVVRGLKIGQTGGPIGNGTDYRLVRLTGHRPGPIRSLAEVRPEIQRRAHEAKQKSVYEAWLAEQEQKSKIEWLI